MAILTDKFYSVLATLLDNLNISINFKDLKIFDIIDIALVSFFVYIFLSFIKDTRAWSLIKGIFVLFLIYVLFIIAQLNTMAWIINGLFSVGIIAIIVLFQPEIRRILEQLGRSRFNIQYSEPINQLNSEIIKAVRFLSSEMTGALICIERNIPIGDYEKTGILIDGLITSQLLINIFVDKTPLHDGAVIIRKERLAAAGCILPVTSQEIGKELGTRHRAAVGLSETTDALIIIVSEETGKISIAEGGKLTKDVSKDMLLKSIDQSNKDEQSLNSFFAYIRRLIK